MCVLNNGYLLPHIVGGYAYIRPWLMPDGPHDLTRVHGLQHGEYGWLIPDPCTYQPVPHAGHTYILGSGPSYKAVRPEPGSRVVYVNAAYAEPLAGVEQIHICQDWYMWQKRQYLTIISDELIPYYTKELYPVLGPVMRIPSHLQGKSPTIIVACQLFTGAGASYSLHGIDAYHDPNAPAHYAIQREALKPYITGERNAHHAQVRE